MFGDAELIRKNIARNNAITETAIKRGDFVRLYDVSMFESTEIDTENERDEIDNGSREIVDRENNIANDSDDVAEIVDIYS